MRVFVALEIPDPVVLDALVAAQKELSDTGADLRLVERQNLHFTVRFLGEISEAQTAEADSRLRSLSLKGAEVELRGLGAFPSAGRPSVLWAGVAPGHDGRVAPIAQEIIGALGSIGHRDDRPFRAHLTLARVRSGRNGQALASFLLANDSRSFGIVRVSSLKLKASNLTPRGPVYTDVGVYSLG